MNLLILNSAIVCKKRPLRGISGPTTLTPVAAHPPSVLSRPISTSPHGRFTSSIPHFALPDIPPVIELDSTTLDKNYTREEEQQNALLTYHDSTIEEVLRRKKQFKEPEMISEEKSVFEAITMMSDKKLGALIVHDKVGNIAGIFTERDYLNKIAVRGPARRALLNR